MAAGVWRFSAAVRQFAVAVGRFAAADRRFAGRSGAVLPANRPGTLESPAAHGQSPGAHGQSDAGARDGCATPLVCRTTHVAGSDAAVERDEKNVKSGGDFDGSDKEAHVD